MTEEKNNPRRTLRQHLDKVSSLDEKRRYLYRIKSKLKLLSREYAEIVPQYLSDFNRYCAEEVLKARGEKFYDNTDSERYLSCANNIGNPDIVLAEVLTVISRPTYWGNRGGDIRDYYLVDLKKKKHLKIEHFGEVSPEAYFGQFRLEDACLDGDKLKYTIYDVASKNPYKPKTIEKSLAGLL